MARRDWDITNPEEKMEMLIKVMERQGWRDAVTGEKIKMADLGNMELHHALPASHKGVDSPNLDKFGRSIDNFVAVTKENHLEEAHLGKFNGLVLSPQEFRYSHAGVGGNEHKEWAKMVNGKWDEAFDKEAMAKALLNQVPSSDDAKRLVEQTHQGGSQGE